MAKRVDYINGIKGLSALSISFFHFLIAYAPFGYVGYGSGIASEEQLDYYLSYYPFSILSNGDFGLYHFIAIIGFIPAYHYFQFNDNAWIRRQAIIRYARFTPPIFFCCVLVYIAYACGFLHAQELGHLLHNSFNLITYKEAFTLSDIFSAGFYRVLFIKDDSFNAVFWCMPIIFLGSYLVYAGLLLFGSLKRRCLIYLALLVLCLLSPLYTTFLAGVIAADLLTQAQQNPPKHRKQLIIACLILSLFCFCFPKVLLPSLDYCPFIYAFGAFFSIYAAGLSIRLQKLLSHPFLSKCGEHSFAIIIVHFPLLYTLPAWVFIQIYTPENYLTSLCIALLLFVFTTALGTYLFDKMLAHFPKWLAEKFYQAVK